MSEEREGARPSYTAYQVNDGPEDKSYFNRVGAAFAHRDGKGHTLQLDAMLVDGRVVMRTPQERLEDTRSEKPRRRSRENER